MLGKLLKYDFKAVSKLLAIINGAVLVCAIAGALFVPFISRMGFTENTLAVIWVLAFFFFMILFMASSFATYITLASRFYKNLFSNEGFVSRTLPVTSSMHLLSKTIMGFTWALINSVVLFASLGLLLFVPDIKEDLPSLGYYLSELGYSNMQKFIFDLITFGIMFLLSILSGVLMIYCSIALGQLMSSTHKILASVAMYFVLSTVVSLFSTAITIPTMFKTEVAFENPSYVQIMDPIAFYTSIMSLILAIIMYLITDYIMRKKVNL